LISLACGSFAVSQTKPVAPPSPAPASRLAAAPSTPSPQSDKVLRQRATQFMQYTIDRGYRKAYELVAEETKDWYLSSGKPQYTKFQIEAVEYSKDRKMATVKSKVTRVLSMNGREIATELVVEDRWKFVAGNWMWWHDPNVLVTPFGEVKIDRSKGVAVTDDKTMPRDMSPEAAAKAAQGLNLDATTDKKELVFEQGRPGDLDLVFHNGLKGFVRVTSDIIGDYRGFSVDPPEIQVAADSDLKLHVHYKPVADLAGASLRISIDPFNRTLNVPLSAQPAASVSQ